MIRVLYLIDSMTFGGAESSLYYLVSHLASARRDDYKFDICVLYNKGHFGRLLEKRGISVYSLGLRGKYDIVRLSRLSSIIRSQRYHFVHTHLFPANWFGALAARSVNGTVFLTTEHSVWNRRRQYPFLRPVERSIYHHYSRIVAVSRPVKSSLLEWVPDVDQRVVVIPNAIPPMEMLVGVYRQASAGNSHSLPRRRYEQLVMFIGSLRHPKGADVLIDALPEIIARGPADVWIVGDGAQHSKLEARVKAKGLDRYVSFLGFRQDIPRLLQEASLVVMPSRWEGLPMALLETMAMGKPVVASAVGGIPELIQHGETGWLVPPGNADALAQAVSYVLTNPHLAQVAGRTAKSFITQNYAVEAIAQRLLNLYEALL